MVAMLLVASFVVVSPAQASGPRANPRVASRAFSRELGRQRAQAASLRIRGFNHAPSSRAFSSGTRVIILR